VAEKSISARTEHLDSVMLNWMALDSSCKFYECKKYADSHCMLSRTGLLSALICPRPVSVD
jgi:hypothetical protein